MMNTALTLYKNPTDRSVDYYNVDLDEKVAFPLTFSIADIREPESRNSTFSKTITLPGTDANNKTFGFLFDISAEGSYDPNTKVDCEVVSAGQRVVKGVIRLTNILRDRHLKAISYEVNIFGSISNIFQEIGTAEMTDLDFSEYDHNWTRQNVMASWDDYIIENGAPYANWSTTVIKTFSNPQNNGGRLQITLGSTAGMPAIVTDETMVYISLNNLTPGNDNAYVEGYATVRSWNPGSLALVLNLPYLATPTFTGEIKIEHENDGKGYVYALIDEGYTNGTNYSVENYKPAIYAKAYWDKIFDSAGYTYDSEFLESAFFKRLIVPFSTTSFKLTADEINERSTRVYLSYDIGATVDGVYATAGGFPGTNLSAWYNFDQTPLFGPTAPDFGYPAFGSGTTAGVKFDVVDYDDGNNYDPTTGIWTCPHNGYYTFGSLIAASNLLSGSTGATGATLSAYVFNTTNIASQSHPILLSGVKKTGTNSNIAFGVFQPVYLQGFGAGSTATHTSQALGGSQYLAAGDKLVTSMYMSAPKIKYYHPNEYWAWGGPLYNNQFQTRIPTVNPTLRRTFHAGSQFSIGPAQLNIVEGNMISMNQCIIQKMKQKDFILNIVKMFNLYIEVDQDDPKKLYITPRNDFYNTTDSVDWTDNLEAGKTYKINTMSDIKAKKYVYTYTEDKDFLNDDHVKTYGNIYGTQEVDVNSDFSTSTKETKVTFSPTVLSDYPVGSDRVISQVVSVDTNGAVKQIAYKPRILFFGMRGTKQEWQFTGTNIASLGLFRYPYAGHIDNPYGAQYDLNWGFPRGIYYNYTTWTDNNLFNEYHRNYIEEITDIDARMLIADFKLEPSDISTLDFRVPIKVDRVVYRLNKITDWDPEVKVCNVELVKAKNLAKWKRTTVYSWPGGWPVPIGPTFPGGVLPVTPDPPGPIRPTKPGLLADFAGNVSVPTQGNDIRTSKDSFIMGTTNSTGGFDNVFIFGDGLTATKSNQLVGQGFTIDLENGSLTPTINRSIGGADIVYNRFPTISWANYSDGGADDVTGNQYPDVNVNREIGGTDTV